MDNTARVSTSVDGNLLIDHKELQSFVIQVFQAAGFSEEKALDAANVLIQADLKGIDSHGVARLSGYLRQIEAGQIQVKGHPQVIHETPSTATLDAQQSIGLLSARAGMQNAIAKAEQAGSGWVAIKNSSHFGIAAAHTELALEKDMIGLAMTNASPLVAPAGGVEARLGTNPICLSIPAGEEPPVIVDMATTVVANGKLEIAERQGKNVPQGWVQTQDGGDSKYPDELKSGGTLLPLGSNHDCSYHKGYALGSVVDILSGVLSGANFGPWVPPFVPFLEQAKAQVGEGIGHFVGAFRVDAFRPASEFKDSMDQWIRSMRETQPAEGTERVKIPGDPERDTMKERLENGIPLNERVYENLKDINEKLGLDFFK